MKIYKWFNLFLLLTILQTTTACKDKFERYDHHTEDEEQLAEDIISANYKIRFDSPQQIIEGLGVEIQSDRFGPDYTNNDPVNGIPYELAASEKERLATDVVKGFRYIRLAMGLWFRGTTEDRKNIIERYPGQLESIRQLIERSGVEGISLEYWSPAPYWKQFDSFVQGSIKQFDDNFLHDFGDALVRDLKYLENAGIYISTWGLQNEVGNYGLDYPHCYYTDDNYIKTFKVVAPKIRSAAPNAEIIVDSWGGNWGTIGRKIKEDSQLLDYVDAWVFHRTGDDADKVIEGKDKYLYETRGKPVYTNEYEYFAEQVKEKSKDWRLVNIAQNMMNWMTFVNSPKWYWLHALKPTNDSNWEGFGLGTYRPSDDLDFSKFQNVQKGEFEINRTNFNALAGFLKYMPWDSRRYAVEEEEIRNDQRIMCWKKPDGKFVFALTNRSDNEFEYVVEMDKARSFTGHRYTRDITDQTISDKVSASVHTIHIKPWSIEFWIED